MPIDPHDPPLDGSPIRISMDAEVDSDGVLFTHAGEIIIDTGAIPIQKTIDSQQEVTPDDRGLRSW